MQNEECVYILYVKTGSRTKAGTDSKISITLGDSVGRSVRIMNLKSWGLMNPKYDYFKRDNLDIFSVRGPCIGTPVCQLNLTSDGSGSQRGWYCDFIEVTFTGSYKHCSQTLFTVDRWLATDVPPYTLTAELNGCSKGGDEDESPKLGRFVVGNSRRRSAYA